MCMFGPTVSGFQHQQFSCDCAVENTFVLIVTRELVSSFPTKIIKTCSNGAYLNGVRVASAEQACILVNGVTSH